LASERLEAVERERISLVFISAVPPGALTPARYLCKRLRGEFPKIKLIVGIWQSNPDLPRLQKRLGPALTDGIFTSLGQALEHIVPMASQTAPESAPTMPSASTREPELAAR
jgi:hypothetical protein